MNFWRFFTSLVVGVVCLLQTAAYAQVVSRVVPANAAYGEMSPISGNQVVIGAYAYRLAPGLQVRGRNNLLVFPDAMRDFSGALKVRYLTDMNGDLYRVWILTDDEIAALRTQNLPAQPLPQPSAPPIVAPGEAAISPSL